MSSRIKKRRHRQNLNLPGQAHELTFFCYRRIQLLSKERSCQWLAESIDSARIEQDFALWAYVFMPEHVHLIVFPRRPNADIADIRQAIKEPVGRKAIEWLRKNSPQWLPRLTVGRGTRVRRYFWQPGGGYDRNIDNPRTLLKMIDYIHENPCRRQLCQRAADWKWSSADWYHESRPGPLRIDPIPADWLSGID